MGTETTEPVTYHNIDVDHTIPLIGPLNIQNNDVLLIVQRLNYGQSFLLVLPVRRTLTGSTSKNLWPR